MKWVRQVLAQHGAREKNIAGAVTDAGSDISTGVGKHFKREWCTPHMLDRATMDGTGMSNSRSTSKNPETRDLLDLLKKVAEHFNRSTGSKIMLENEVEILSDGKGSKAKLSQAVVQRWISICTMVLRLLQKWDALETCYVRKGDPFPLAKLRVEFEEVYIILRVVKDTTVYCQTTNEATAEGGLQRVFLLLTNTLEPTQQLQAQHVPAIGQEDADAPWRPSGLTTRSLTSAARLVRPSTRPSQSGSCRATEMAYTTALICSTT
ncbi:unnamed protein product [Laminaria digitata]